MFVMVMKISLKRTLDQIFVIPYQIITKKLSEKWGAQFLKKEFQSISFLSIKLFKMEKKKESNS